MRTEKILLFDSTMRDGEQQPMLCFRDDEKIALSYQLVDMGVSEIDLMPSIDEHERTLMKLLNDTSLREHLGANTMVARKYIDQAVDVNARVAYIFVHVSDKLMEARNKTREQNLADIVDVIDYGLQKELIMDFCSGDSTRADRGYLKELLTEIKPKIRFYQTCDTAGILTPETSAKHAEELTKIIGDGRLVVHYHDDNGLSVENVIAALKNGAVGFDSTFLGIGERAGNVAMEQVLYALRDKYSILVEGVDYGKISETVEMVKKMCRGIPPPSVDPNRAYPNVSGIHARAILGSRDAFGLDYKDGVVETHLFFGKHSGRNNYRLLFGDRFSDKEYEEMRDTVKRLSREQLRDFTAPEIREMFGK